MKPQKLNKPRFWSTRMLNPNKFLKNSDDFFNYLFDEGITQAKASRILQLTVQCFSHARKNNKVCALWLNHLKLIKINGEQAEEIKELKAKIKDIQDLFQKIQIK